MSCGCAAAGLCCGNPIRPGWTGSRSHGTQRRRRSSSAANGRSEGLARTVVHFDGEPAKGRTPTNPSAASRARVKAGIGGAVVIPQVVTVRVHSGRGRRVRLWIPLLPVFVVLSPLVALVLVVLVVACVVHRIDPVRALYAGWRLLWSLSGTRIEIEQGGTAVLVNVR